MAEVTKAILRGLLIPTATTLANSSGLYDASGTKTEDLPEAEARPGIAVPAQSSRALVEATSAAGTYDRRDVTLIAGRPGHPDRQGAAMYWEDSDGHLYGWEAPTVITAFREISNIHNLEPHLVALPSGRFLLAGTYSNSGLYLRLTLLSSQGAAIASNDYHDQSAVASRTLHYFPTLLVMGSRVWCYFIGEESDGSWSIRSIYSDDEGLTWNLGALRIDGQTFAIGTYIPHRLRVAAGNDQVLLLCDFFQGVTNGIAQFVSYDQGASFRLVAGLSAGTAALALGGGMELVFAKGKFVCIYIQNLNLYPWAVSIGLAESPIGYATSVQIENTGNTWASLSGLYLDDYDLCATVAENGTIYLTGRLVGGDDEWVCYRSIDAGETWETMGASGLTSGAGKWWDGETAGSAPVDASCCWSQGCMFVACSGAGAVASDGGFYVARLGGWSTLTMSPLISAGDESDQATWNRTWLAFDLPQNQGWTRTPTGTVTETLGSGGLRLQVNSGLSSVHYEENPTGTSRLIAEGVASVTTGDVLMQARLDDGASGYAVRILLSSTSIEAQDVYGSSIVTAAISGTIRWRIHLKAGNVSVWYSSEGSQVWSNLVESYALVDSGGSAGNNQILWGAEGGSSAVDAYWYRLAFGVGESVAGLVPLSDPPSRAKITGDKIGVREGLHPRPLASTPQYLTAGVAVALRAGPILTGQEWLVSSTSPYRSENCLPAIASSPRDIARWEADTIGTPTELRLVVDLDPSLAAPNVLLGLYLDNIYGGPWEVDAWDPDGGGSWSNQATLEPITFSADVVAAGDYWQLKPTTSAGRLVRLGELVGCAVEVWDSSSKITRIETGRVVSCSEGRIDTISAGPARLARIVVEGLSAGTGRYFEIHPRRAVALINAAAISSTRPITRLRLRRPLSTAGYLLYGDVLGEIGVLAAGPVAVFGKDYSEARNIEHQQSTTTSTQRDGRRLVRQDAPIRRVVEFAWVEGVDLTDIRAIHDDSTHQPDYVSWDDEAVAHRHDTALLLADLLEQQGGAALPVVYLPYVPGDGGPVWLAEADLARGAVYGRITSSVRQEQAVGDEELTDLVRVQSITIEEEL